MIDLIVLKSLFLLFLIMAGSFIGDIFNCTLKKILTNNIYIKHIVFIFLIYFTIDFTDNKRKHPFKILKLTIMLWTFYMMTIRMDIYFTLIVFILLFILYIIDEYFEYIIQEEIYAKFKNFENLNFDKKDEIKKTLENKHNYLKEINNVLEYIIVITVLMGFILYFVKQNNRKKSKFPYYKFLLGDLTCSWEN